MSRMIKVNLIQLVDNLKSPRFGEPGSSDIRWTFAQNPITLAGRVVDSLKQPYAAMSHFCEHECCDWQQILGSLIRLHLAADVTVAQYEVQDQQQLK